MTAIGARVTADGLLDQYAPGDFFLATAHETLLARGVARSCTDDDAVRLSERVADALAESSAPLAVGALPFDTAGAPGHAVLPSTVATAPPAHPAAAAFERRQVGVPVAVRPVPTPELHAEAVAKAVAALNDRDMRKVVLARALDVDFDEDVRAAAILRNLVKDNASGYTFAVGLPGGCSLIGSSPELLLSRRGDRVVSHPLAGTAPRSADPAEDAENAAGLLASRKNQVEHAVTVEAVVETLRPFCRKLTVPDGPQLVATPAVWHLGTRISGELKDRDVTAFRLAAALHPTPAICGSPTESARELVGDLEPFDRGYYAGTVGWVDAAGDGEWAVAIRCAQVLRRSMRLYAGGGIVPASEPVSELDETSVKFRILLRAMGLPPEL
ncbi:isochorismate synthase [Amycolatopsis sp. CA-230715]|uniref:isochorismate synthase n=1 Tax=Amycolatopsis sp. CA-230715 TaxID=2745196 RepID=UPI001C323C5C|nr:isochorismate synthase [Amycolatopsis sp. CA-230715]QWF81788.1 Isochorismate synthase DhbC [Amycolatopsis sp. CA-230715]